MSAEFDVYALALEPLQIGSIVKLDGIDGFFDQYFEGRRPGEAIRFLSLGGAPAPQSAAELEALAFIEGSVVRCADIEADIDVLSAISFGEWLLNVDAPLISKDKLQMLCPEVNVLDLLRGAAINGVAYWRNDAKRWRDLSQTTAVLARFLSSEVQIAIVKTNAIPGSVVKIRYAA